MVEDRLFGALTARLRGFSEDHDPSGLLDPAAIAETADLWRMHIQAGTGTQPRWDVVAVVANLYLGRWQVLPGEEARADAVVALAFCRVLAAADPDAIPEPVSSVLAEDPGEPPDEIDLLTRLGRRALAEHQRTGHPGVLDAAIEALRDTAAFTPPGDSLLATRLSDLGFALFTRSKLLTDDTELDAAIDIGQQSAAVIPAGHPDPATVHGRLWMYLAERFERTSDRRDLDAAIASMRQAVTLSAPTGPALHAARLSELANSLRTRFDLSGDMQDLDGAITLMRQALPLRETGGEGWSIQLANLGSALLDRFGHTGRAEDITAAVDASRAGL